MVLLVEDRKHRRCSLRFEPLSDMLVALSYAPVNGFLATGHLQVGASNAINVTKALDVTVIGNTDGNIQTQTQITRSKSGHLPTR